MSQSTNINLIPQYTYLGNLYFSQNDVGREATINLMDGSVAYTIPTGATVKLQATKPSGLGFSVTCAYSGNVVTVVSTATMTDEAGRFPCELQVTNSGVVLGSANFMFNVERNPHPDGTTDGTAESVLNDITVAYNNAMTSIENSGGLTRSIKNAILNCFQHVAWIDEHGQEYYDDLEDAFSEVTAITLNSSSLLFNSLNTTQQLTASLTPSSSTAQVSWASSDTSVATVSSSGLVTSVAYGNCTITATANDVTANCSVAIEEITVVSLSAVLDAGGHVFYVNDPVDDIKPYLTVTATLSDSTTTTVPSGSYTLSGSLSQEGSNTITVSYGGKTTTVTVNAVVLVLESISATYTQSGTVYDNQSLDSLKADLVVTASWDDSSTTTLSANDYSLSGTLTTGTSTITVSYGGKTDTFNVTVTHATIQYTITNTLTQCVNSNNASVINELTAYSGTLSANSGYILTTVTVMMGNTDITSTAYNSSTGVVSIASVTGNIAITAEAIEDVGWISGQAYELEWETYDIVASTGEVGTNASYKHTDYLPCHGVTAIKFISSGVRIRAWYDENYDYIAGSSIANGISENHIIVPDGAYYVRLSTNNINDVSATPYLYPTLDENTVWESGKIYNFAGLGNLMFCYGATTIEMLVDLGIYGYRGYYSLYDSAKQRTNSMGNTNNFNHNNITVQSADFYFSLSCTDTNAKFLVRLS